MTIDMYNKIGAESEVMDASPHRLIQLLFERCLQQIQLAKHYMERRDIPKKCAAINHAMDVIIHLKASLNFNDDKAKEISGKLNDVYTYIEKNLLRANLKNDLALLDDIYEKLIPIKTAWDDIGDKHGK